MNLELKKFRDIVENRIDHNRGNEIPGLEPASEGIKIDINQTGHISTECLKKNWD